MEMEFDNFDYEKLTQSLQDFAGKHLSARLFSAGKSVDGRELWCVTIGRGKKKVFLNGAHHALEWITSSLLASFLWDFAAAAEAGEKLGGYNARNAFERCTYTVLPMVNPDGVQMVLHGINQGDPNYDNIVRWLSGQDVQEVWQANLNGVDLNHNYDALFEEGKQMAAEVYGITGPGPTRWSGLYPFSEPETAAVRRLVLEEEFPLAVAFHTQGEVIYWSFNGNRNFRMQAEVLSRASGYALDETEGVSSYSGFKDWYLDKFDLPAFTVEAGLGENPLPFSQLDDIKRACYPLILACAAL